MVAMIMIFANGIVVCNAETVASGYCGGDTTAEYDEASKAYKNISWKIDSEGDLTLSGEGVMKSYTVYTEHSDDTYVEFIPWYSYGEDIKSITIGPGISNIGSYIFYKTGAESITIPDSVCSIERNAFQACKSLKRVDLPDSVRELGEQLYYDCNSLEQTNIPEGITAIGPMMFYNCTKLKRVNLPDSLISIEDNAFISCSNLTTIHIPKNLVSIKAVTFESCNIQNITVSKDNETYCVRDGILFKQDFSEIVMAPKNLSGRYQIPEEVNIIGPSCFYSCKELTGIIIPDSVTEIPKKAFSQCSGLKEIVFPDRITSIGDYAFCGCGFTEIEFPYGVDTIKAGTFASCKSLEKVDIPSSVKKIESEAFNNCNNLVSVVIPASVNSVENRSFGVSTALLIFEGDAPTVGKQICFNRANNTVTIRYYENKSGWGTTYWAEFIQEPMHAWGAWEVCSEPTEKESGLRKHICKYCGKSESEYYENEDYNGLPRLQIPKLDKDTLTVMGSESVKTGIEILSTKGEDISDKVEVEIAGAEEVYEEYLKGQSTDYGFVDRTVIYHNKTIVASGKCIEGDYEIIIRPVRGKTTGKSRSVMVHVVRGYKTNTNTSLSIEYNKNIVIPSSADEVVDQVYLYDVFQDDLNIDLLREKYDTDPNDHITIDMNKEFELLGPDATTKLNGEEYGITFDKDSNTIHYSKSTPPGNYFFMIFANVTFENHAGGLSVSFKAAVPKPITVTTTDLSFSVNGQTISATRNGEDCGSITMLAPTATDTCVSNNDERSPQITGNIEGYKPTFRFFRNGKHIPPGRHLGPGNYTVYMDVGDASTSVSYVIEKGSPLKTAPSAADITYSGESQDLVSEGTITDAGATILYSLGDNDTSVPEDGWCKAVPQATEAGVYYVWYKVDGGTEYYDIEETCIPVEVKAPHVHSWNDGQITIAATCISKGEKTFRCTTCGAEKKEEIGIDADAHLFNQEIAEDKYLKSAATCSDPPIYYRSCGRCGKKGADTFSEGQALGHKWVLDAETAATCDTDGERVYKCSNDGCNQTYSETIGKTGHEYSEEWTTDEVHHWQRCSNENCDEVNSYGTHEWITSITKRPSCTENGEKTFTCSICGKTRTEEVGKTDHVWNYVVDKEPTCETEGYESLHCAVCGDAKTGTTRSLPAKGHTFGAWTTTKPATEATAGQQSHKCSVCGKSETKDVVQLPPSLTIVKITNPKAENKSVTVRWNKVSKKNQKKIAKIQIQYSTDKHFKKDVKKKLVNARKTSYKIKGLKSKKKYYVRVRAYTKTGTTEHVSKWSAVKAVKVK